MWRTIEYIKAKTNYNHEALRSAYHKKVTKKFNRDVARFSGQVGKMWLGFPERLGINVVHGFPPGTPVSSHTES